MLNEEQHEVDSKDADNKAFADMLQLLKEKRQNSGLSGGCDGPHKDDADRRGDRSFEDVMQLLKEKYFVVGPISDKTEYPPLAKAWENDKDALRAALREIIFTQDCLDW
jgi:hypothetical protein